MSAVENINHEKEQVPTSWVPRVITGGKGPPSGPDEPIENWLETFECGTVFACRSNVSTVDWEIYYLVHRYTNIYLLKTETPDGKVWERRVDPKMFCKHYRSYEVIAVYDLNEAPTQGDNDGSQQQCNHGGYTDLVRNAPDE